MISPDFSYINSNGKRVSGSAAFMHYVYTVMGGIQNYNDIVGTTYIMNWVRSNSGDINREIAKTAKKQHLKVV